MRGSTRSPAAASPLLSYVPTSAELALMQAQAALVDAVRSQHTSRLRIELLPPGLNRAIENSHAYREPLLGFTALCLANALHGLRVGVLFSSAGSAASAADVYSRRTGGRLVGAHVRLGAIDGAVTRERIDVERHDFTQRLLIQRSRATSTSSPPSNSRGDAVVLALEQAVRCGARRRGVSQQLQLHCQRTEHYPRQKARRIEFASHASRSRGDGALVHLWHQDVRRVPPLVGQFEPCYYRGVYGVQRPSTGRLKGARWCSGRTRVRGWHSTRAPEAA